MVNRNIIKIRKSLDKLDNSLLDIIKKRSKLVDIVIQNKKFKKDIVYRLQSYSKNLEEHDKRFY
jgi:chorismate mutase